MKKQFDLSSIMGAAWSIRRKAAQEMGCRVSEVLFSECLKMAWAAAHRKEWRDHAGDNAAAVVAEWDALQASADLVSTLGRWVRYGARQTIRYSIADKYLQFSEIPAFYTWFNGKDGGEFENECWERVQKNITVEKLTERNLKRAKSGLPPVTLDIIGCKAGRAAVSAVYVQDVKHSRAQMRTVNDGDGGEEDYISMKAAAPGAGTESAAIAKIQLATLLDGLDDIGRAIVDGLDRGLTERQIAEEIGGISNVAIHKRIVKMRATLEAMEAA